MLVGFLFYYFLYFKFLSLPEAKNIIWQIGNANASDDLFIGVTKRRKCSIGSEKVRWVTTLEFHGIKGYVMKIPSYNLLVLVIDFYFCNHCCIDLGKLERLPIVA